MTKSARVLRKKKEIDNAKRSKRKDNITSLKDDAKYRGKLQKSMPSVDVLLDNSKVSGVIVKVADADLALFANAIVSEEMSVYNVDQIDENTFIISSVELFI